MSTCLAELLNSTPLNGHTAAEVTETVFVAFKRDCPEEYQRLADQLIRQAIHAQVVAREHSRNAHRRELARRAAVNEARDQAVDLSSLKAIDRLYVCNVEQERKPLQTLSHEERMFALARFDQQIQSRQLERAFLAEVDRRCGDRTVAEVLDPDTVNRLFVSIVGELPSD